jgi:hypothetical protein
VRKERPIADGLANASKSDPERAFLMGLGTEGMRQ